MPIQLYYCPRCKQTQEYLLSSSGAKPQECANPECGVEGRFLDRQYHNQTASLRDNRGHKKVSKITPLLTITSLCPVCGPQSLTILREETS
jgi:hypothetical protein